MDAVVDIVGDNGTFSGCVSLSLPTIDAFLAKMPLSQFDPSAKWSTLFAVVDVFPLPIPLLDPLTRAYGDDENTWEHNIRFGSDNQWTWKRQKKQKCEKTEIRLSDRSVLPSAMCHEMTLQLSRRSFLQYSCYRLMLHRKCIHSRWILQWNVSKSFSLCCCCCYCWWFCSPWPPMIAIEFAPMPRPPFELHLNRRAIDVRPNHILGTVRFVLDRGKTEINCEREEKSKNFIKWELATFKFNCCHGLRSTLLFISVESFNCQLSPHTIAFSKQSKCCWWLINRRLYCSSLAKSNK